MITVVSDEQDIEKYHKQFQRRLDRYFTQQINCWVGYPGGNFQDTVRYSANIDLWISVQELDTRYWNGFGVGKPYEGTNNSLNGEINFPYSGLNRRISGAFAIENNGNILVLHRGRIRGVWKDLFMDSFRGDKLLALDGNRETEFCLVGELNSQFLAKQVAFFVSEIKRIKYFIESDENNFYKEINNYQFTSESFGQSTIASSGDKTYNRTHGIIVDALASILETNGYKIGNDRNRDLFIHNKNKIITLFEIKTSSSTQDLYSAVGQLLIYSIPIQNPIRLILVLPDKLNKTVENRLNKLGIETLYYKWENDEPEFIELLKLMVVESECS